MVTQWECDWRRRVKAEPLLEAFVKQQRVERVEPLQPRDAFFGGRTNAVRLHHRTERERETIRYQDVTSLYPWVNKYAQYPVGHPTILRDIEGVDVSDYFGVCKITIVPPRGLFHPVLPHRHGGKLVFPLCKMCVETEMGKSMRQRSSTCRHDDTQCALTGTWCTPEVAEAVSCGYRIVRIHEVWHFPPDQRRLRLFAPYVDTWLRLKTESSGYPRHDGRGEASLRVELPRSRGHHPPTPTRQKESWKESDGQAHAQFFLGQVWRKFAQVVHGRRHHPLRIVPTDQQPAPRDHQPPHLQRGGIGGARTSSDWVSKCCILTQTPSYIVTCRERRNWSTETTWAI